MGERSGLVKESWSQDYQWSCTLRILIKDDEIAVLLNSIADSDGPF